MSAMTKADNDELVRLREKGCEFVIKFRGFPLPFGISGTNEYVFARRKFGWIPSGYRQHIAAAIAEYERAQEGK